MRFSSASRILVGNMVAVRPQRQCSFLVRCCSVASSLSKTRNTMSCSTKASSRHNSALAVSSEFAKTQQSSLDVQQLEAMNTKSSNAMPKDNADKTIGRDSKHRRGLGPSTALIARITQEYKHSEHKRRKKLEMQKYRAKLIAYVIKDDYHAALALTANLASNSSRTKDAEIFPATLLMMARGLRAAAAEKSAKDEMGPVGLLDAIVDLCTQMPKLAIVDMNSTAAMLVLLDAVFGLNAKRGDGALDERVRELESACRLMLDHRPLTGDAPITYMTFAERDAVDRSMKRISDTWQGWREMQGVRDLRYDRTVPLLEELHENASEAEYLGSPYAALGFDQTSFLALMKEQLALEVQGNVSAKNVWRKESTGKSAEEMLAEYDWPTAIAREIKLELQNLKDPHLGTFISTVSVEDLVKVIMEMACSIAQSGQNTSPISFARSIGGNRLLRMVRTALYRKIGFFDDQTLEKLAAEYSRYFCEEDLPRRYTHREWWLTCAAEMGVDPSLQCPLLSLGFDSALPGRLGRFIVDVMQRACKFQIKNQEFPAFYECNVDFMKMGSHGLNPTRKSKEKEKDVNAPQSGVRMVRMIGCDLRLALKLKDRFDHITFEATDLPMLVPPRPWLDNYKSGGLYATEMSAIRLDMSLEGAEHIDLDEELARRCRTPSQMRPVIDALNSLGNVAWRVNEPILDIAMMVFKKGNDPKNMDLLVKLNMPMTTETVQMPEVPSMLSYGHFEPLSIEEKFEFVNAKHELYQKKKERNEVGQIWISTLYRLSIAQHMRGRIFFSPQYMDFRSRVYPIPPYFNHTGSDLIRACFMFAKGEPLGKNGLDWLKIHCINVTGKKKRNSNEERLAFANENLDKILDSADHPLDGEQWWLETDDPCQVLAACFEIRDAIRSGDPASFVSHLPVHQDGSCNGLQHYAALGRDQVGAFNVNLLPAERPQDVYTSVAERVEEKRLLDESNSDNESTRLIARELRKLLPGPVARKTIKQTVMTTVYGVTNYGAMLQIKRQLRLLGFSDKQSRVFAVYLANLTLTSLDEAFVSSMQLKRWFRECAAMISGKYCMRTMEWMTPLAMPVVQPYVFAKIAGDACYLKPQANKQMNSFPPNYIHSLDATHMMLTALHAHRLGMTFSSVHDCFWTHAAHVPLMNTICRQQFINLHQIPLIELLGGQLSKTYLTDQLRKDIGDEMFEKLEAQLLPMHTFGKLQIEEVANSVFFFS